MNELVAGGAVISVLLLVLFLTGAAVRKGRKAIIAPLFQGAISVL